MNGIIKTQIGIACKWIMGVIMGLAILSLPVTSMPLLSRLAGGTQVAPLAVVFLALVALVWLPVYVLRKGLIPREVIPLLAFVIVALISSLMSFFLSLPAYKGFSYIREMLSALFTLAAGVITYLAFSTWYRRASQLAWAFKLISISGALVLVWSVAQIIVIYFFDGQYPSFMAGVHNFFSVRSLDTLTFTKRVTGFAFEPSWLAHQLNVFYLPFWAAATITGYTAFKRRIFKLSIENLLLVFGVIVMLLSFSRIGLLTLLLVIAFLVYRLTVFLVQRGSVRVMRSSLTVRWPWLRSRWWLGSLLAIGLFAVYALLVMGLIIGLSSVDNRLAQVLTLRDLPDNIFYLAGKLAFAERLSYWAVGWNVMTNYPLLGVGLGNTGFFFSRVLPLEAGMLNEILSMRTVWALMPHPKNLWVRLLAETGVVGFSVFLSWLFVLWRSAKFLLSTGDHFKRTCGWMGLITILALIGEGFSVDSFALPYFWASLGIVTAVSMFARRGAADIDSTA